MSILSRISDFFQSVFKSSAPDVKKRMAIRKIENDLKVMAPKLYKNGLILENFAEALRIMFINTKPVQNILAETLCSDEMEHNRIYEEQLLLTGFEYDTQKEIESLSYENRKAAALEAKSLSRYFDSEHKKLESIVRQLNTPEFIRIDGVLNRIKQLNDICRYSYMTALRLFDPGFSGADGYKPLFQPVLPDLMETSLLDLYYVVADMDISNSVYHALVALLNLRNRGNITEKQTLSLQENLKKIQGLLKHVFTKDILIALIRIAKSDTEFIPVKATYNGNSRQKYADYLEERFRVDESRLKTDIQDATISSEMRTLFGDTPMVNVSGYSNDLNSQLLHSTPFSFTWVLPMQILKTFDKIFYEDHTKALLNDIVIEGFFNNPNYKTDFSSIVFTCNETSERIAAFEKMFTRGNEYDEVNISSLIHDSHKDSSFATTLRTMIEKINAQAKSIIQSEVNSFHHLYKIIQDIELESKKPSSDEIANLKVLTMSSRNRDNFETMEAQTDQWKIFLDIMKNYVIIGSIEKK